MNGRLGWLLLLLVAVAVFRWVDTLKPEPSETLAQAIQSGGPGSTSGRREADGPETHPADAVLPDDLTPVGNPFSIRATAESAPVPKSVVAPTQVLQPSIQYLLPQTPTSVVVPPPYRVIGVMSEAAGRVVFLAGPGGTVMARVGEPLPGEFTVVSISADELILRNNASQQEHHLPVPAAPTS